ncbi:hypothetical protein [Streptomyces sp. R301]|uniref:hypothetical protein n=1 Tax=unclassified Streptomyces TaxID=2593676 RepID=UPI003211DE03
MQVIIDADTKLVVAAAWSVPSNTADAKAWRDSARGEHACARMKHCKILRDCRQRGIGLHHAAAHVHNLALAAWPGWR